MGHKHLYGLPRTPPFKRIIRLLGDSAGGGGVAGAGVGSIQEIADATLIASDEGLQRAKSDDGIAYCVYLMAQVTQAARESDFLASLAGTGLPIPRQSTVSHPDLKDTTTPADYTVFDLVSGFVQAVDRHLQHTGSRNDISELAQLAASESLTVLCRPKADTLFGTSESTVQKSLRDLSTRKGFGTLSHDFFARLIRRYLEYHLSRELSNQVGPNRRFANVAAHNEFLRQLDSHCRVATKPLGKFAGEWYSKHRFSKDLTLAKSRGFAAHALDKVRDALSYQEERDAE